MRKRSRPLLCLDVDGVLCPLDNPGGYRTAMTGWGSEQILVSPANITRLRALAQAFELVWATSWEHHANSVIAPLHEIGALPVIEWDTDALGGDVLPEDQPEGWTGYHDWKLPWIERYAGDRPFAWVDDEVSDAGIKWAERRSIPSLFVRPSSNNGLSDDHVVRLLTFAKKCQMTLAGGKRTSNMRTLT